MENENLLNHKHYLERKTLYQCYGFDTDKEAEFIFEKTGPATGRILEVGTGKGHFALALAKKGCRFISIDISDEAQKIAKSNLRYFHLEHLVDFRIEDAGCLGFEDKSFDIVFSVNTIHHLKDTFKAMDELRRIVKPGGRIVLTDFTEAGFEMLNKIHAGEGNVHEVSEFGLRDIGRYLSGKGFKTETHKSLFQEILIAHKSEA